MKIERVKKASVLFVMLSMGAVSLSEAPAQNMGEKSVSLDAFSLIGLLPFTDEYGEPKTQDIRNMWLCLNFNFTTKKEHEVSAGIFVRFDRVALRGQYRMFFNKERQSGAFFGFYGQAEWRRMYWFYNKDNELITGWSFPFVGHDNVYDSFGITGGADLGFRLRFGNIGITPYIGAGFPLYFCSGDMPSQDKDMFNLQNTVFRAIDIGLLIDLFW